MRSVVGSSLRFPLVAIALAAALIVLGAITMRQMPLDVLPEFAPPFVEIQTEAAGLSATEVESLLTVPLEEALTGTAQLQAMRSRSVPGLSSILMIFEPGTDVIRARQIVQERLLTRTLVHVSQPPVMLQPLSATSRVMLIGIDSSDIPLIQQSVLARWKIRPALMGVPGVANVAIWGQRAQQLQVQVDPARMRARGVSLQDVIKASGDALWVSPLSFLNASYPGSGGWIDTPQQRIGVRHVLPISTPEEMAMVVVKVIDGTPVLLGDIGDVVVGHPPLIGDAVVDQGPGLLLVVEKFPWVNTIEVTRGIEATLAELQPGLPGLHIDTTVFRPASFIEESIGNMAFAALIGALLVLLFLLIYNWRVALVCAAAVPLSLVAAAMVLYWRGESINIMVLAGLVVALAVVVDDAIVDGESVARRLRESRRAGNGKPVASVILGSALEMRSSVMYATLVAVVAIVPVFFLEGLTGAFFGPLALSYALAVLASMLVALTVTPALALFLMSRGPVARRESLFMRMFRRSYEAVLMRLVRLSRPAVAFAILVALFFGAVGLVSGVAAPRLGQELIPSFSERDVLIRWEGAPGMSQPEITRITETATHELRLIPGVRKVNAHMGRAVLGDQIVGMNSGEIWVNIDPAADYDATTAAIRQIVDGYPGVRHDVRTYLQDTAREVLAGGTEDIVVRLYGPGLATLRDLAEEVSQRLSNIAGVTDLRTESQVDEPHIQVEVDLAKVEPYGLSPGDVRRAATSMVAGIQVGSLFEEQKVFDVVVWSTPETRHTLTSLREMLIDTPTGEQVALGDVADVRVVSTPTEIRHQASYPRIDIGLNAVGRDMGEVARDVENALGQVNFPLEYHPEVLGEYAERQAAIQRLVGFTLAAAILVLLLLQAAFGSWRLAAMAILILPAAPLGGALTGLLSGNLHTLGALLGMFAVLVLGARNVILIVRHYQRLEREEGEPFGPRLIVRGARERLTPTLMTGIATGLAVLPFVFLGDQPGYEIVRPMAIVILGGIVTSTLLNLFLVPTMYLRVGPSPEPDEASQLVEQPSLSPA